MLRRAFADLIAILGLVLDKIRLLLVLVCGLVAVLLIGAIVGLVLLLV